MTHRQRDGFTLVEMLVATVAGTLVIAISLQVLFSHQRIATVQNAQVHGQQTTRSGLDVLFGEIREISASGGDLVRMESDSVSVRTMRALGVTCVLDVPGNRIIVRSLGGTFHSKDSVFVFLDGDPWNYSDDTWVAVQLGNVSTDTCAGGGPGLALQLHALGSAIQDVQLGSPVRTFERFTYRPVLFRDRWYVGRSSPGGSSDPLVGPIADPSGKGMQFEYLDAFGNATAVPTAVRRIRVTVRTESVVSGVGGQPVADSVTADVAIRNSGSAP